MRKTTLAKALSHCAGVLCLAAFGVSCLPAFGQAAASAVAPAPTQAVAPAQEAPAAAMPSDPKALMQLAAKSNGLTGDGLKPWHVKITFDIPESESEAADHGTIEEWWESDTHYKIAIASAHFEQTEYSNESGVRRSGVRSSAPPIFASIRNSVLHPIPLKLEEIENLKIDLRAQRLGEATLSCLSVASSQPAAGADAIEPYTYCLDADQPVLRIRFYPGSGSRQVLSHIVRFQGRFVAKKIEHTFGGLHGEKTGTLWTVQVDQLEALKPEDEKELNPPSGALPPAKMVTVPEKVSKALLLDHPSPVFPPIAKAAEVFGTVELAATVGADGRVLKLHVVSGPRILQQAALDAVKRWTFKPYVVDGDAAEMETTITVPFILSSKELSN
jgi:TonB family protein